MTEPAGVPGDDEPPGAPDGLVYDLLVERYGPDPYGYAADQALVDRLVEERYGSLAVRWRRWQNRPH